MSSPSPELRLRVLRLYKELLFLGRDYPQGYEFFRQRLHGAFWAQRGLQGQDVVERALEKGEYVRKEIEALYYLKRYRTLRKRYDTNA